MKLRHILEANIASQQSEFKQPAGTPKLQREGDLAWHLYKFFDQKVTNVKANQNPAYRKALVQIITQVITEFKDKMKPHAGKKKLATSWMNVEPRKAASAIASNVQFNDAGQYEEEPYDPEIYDTREEWAHEQEAEREYHEEYNGWRFGGISYALKPYFVKGAKKTGVFGHHYVDLHHTVEKSFKAVEAAIKSRLEQVGDRLPQPTIPKSSIAHFTPKPEVRPFIDDQHVYEVKANLDMNGIVTSIAFYVSGAGGTKQYVVKGIQTMAPAELRKHLSYYKEHTDW